MKTAALVSLIKKHSLVSGCLGAVVVLGGGYLFRSNSMDELSLLAASKVSQEQVLRLNILNGGRLQEQYDSLVEMNRLIAGRVAKISDLARNQQYFYKIEESTGVKLTSLNALAQPSAKIAQKTPFSTVQYSCSVQGSFVQILNFLRHLESGRYFQRLRSASLTQVNIAGGSSDAATAEPIDPRLSLTIVVEFLGEP